MTITFRGLLASHTSPSPQPQLQNHLIPNRALLFSMRLSIFVVVIAAVIPFAASLPVSGVSYHHSHPHLRTKTQLLLFSQMSTHRPLMSSYCQGFFEPLVKAEGDIVEMRFQTPSNSKGVLDQVALARSFLERMHSKGNREHHCYGYVDSDDGHNFLSRTCLRDQVILSLIGSVLAI